MTKLTNLRPALSTLRPKLAYSNNPKSNETRITATPAWKRWYHLSRWNHPEHGLRMRVFIRDLFRCQMCGKFQGDTSKLVADHKRPHRGNPALFWLEDNIQTLCADPCHNSLKQREEAHTIKGMWD